MRHRMQLSSAVAVAACVAAATTAPLSVVLVDGFQIITPHDTRQSSSLRNRRLSKTARPFSPRLLRQQKMSHSRSRLWSSTYNSAATAVAAPPGGSKSRTSSRTSTTRSTNKDVGVFDPIGYYAKSMSSSSSASCRPSSSTVATSEEGSNLWKARGLVLVAAALYGTNFTLVKLLNAHIPSVGASTSLRFTLAALALVPFLFMNGDTNEENEATSSSTFSLPQIPVLLAGMEVGLYNSVGYIAQALGLETTEASKSAFICSLAVVVVPIIDLLKGKTKSMKWSSIVGIILAVVGVGLLELGGGEGGGADMMMNSSTSMLPQLSMGDLFTFLQPLFFGLGFVRMEQALEDHPSEAKRLTAAQLTMVALVSILNCWVLSPALAEHVPSLMANLPPPPNMLEIVEFLSNPSILGALVWTGIVTTALTIYLETLAMQTISAAEATLLFSTEPLWGAAFASVVGGEHLGQAAMAGASMILSGCTVSTVAGGSHDVEEKKEGEKETSCTKVGTINDASLLASKVASVGLLVQTKALVEIRHVIERMMTSAGAATTNEGSQKVTMLPEMISAIVISFESVRQQIKSFPLSIEETLIDS